MDLSKLYEETLAFHEQRIVYHQYMIDRIQKLVDLEDRRVQTDRKPESTL